jgi:hypothetical protein
MLEKMNKKPHWRGMQRNERASLPELLLLLVELELAEPKRPGGFGHDIS